MPDRELGKIMTAAEPADVAQMALIECVRQIADNGRATNRILEGMQSELRDVRERVIKIEASEFKTELVATKAEIDRIRSEDLKALQVRISALELDKGRREGAVYFADGLVKYGPIVIVLISALFVVLLATGKVSL